MHTKFKTIMFDLGKVVVFTNFKTLYTNFANRIGLSPDFVMQYHEENRDKLFTGEISMEQCWDDLERAGGKHREQFAQIWGEEGLKVRRIDQDIVDLIILLRKKYKVGAVSNLFESRMKIDEESGVYDLFDYTCLSCKVHLRKPDPAFFKLALSYAGVAANEAILIDDKEQYVQAAADNGITAIRYSGIQECKENLKKLGIIDATV